MSRIGNAIINIPAGVTVEVANEVITVKGPKGTLSQVMLKDITMKQEENTVILERKNENAKAMQEENARLTFRKYEEVYGIPVTYGDYSLDVALNGIIK